MKVTHRFMLRAGLVLCAAGALGAFGACKSSTSPVTPPPPPPPPPPSAIPAPTGVTATPVSNSKINVAWTDTTAAVTRFQVGRCSGAACTNFVTVKDSIAAATKTFSDTSLTANTSYSYRVRAFSAKDSSAWSTAVSATTLATSGSPAFTMIGAGEISTGASSAGPTGTAKLVSDMLKADPNAFVVTLGDNLVDPAATTFTGSPFDNTWGLATTAIGGVYKDRTYYALGNGDFDVNRGAPVVYGYFSSLTASKGWYSFDKGSWHIVVLNTSDWEHGAGPTFGTKFDASTGNMILVPSEQVDWLTKNLSDARAAGAKCVAVISWERRFYTGGAGTVERQANMRPMAQIMQANKVDLLLSAKDKLYERFAPMNWDNATADPAGFRQFIVGTGGRSSDGLPAGNPATREAAFSLPGNEWGVLKLTLGDGNYSWEFVNTNPASANQDKSAAPVACHS